jgi:geranylgeranyl diphosphate synthase type I
MATDQASPGPARLGQIRREVALALELFLERQRAVLGAIADDLLPCLQAMEELLAGGKRLRPAFCYWGWRGAGGEDCPAIYAAAASLELLQASALIHDDVMDASDTRRGRPAVHRQFSARLAGPNPAVAEQFGTGAAILVGDMLLSWTDEMYQASGFPADALRRGQRALAAMQTEVAAGQYLDLLSQAGRSTSVADAMRVIIFKTAKYTIERPLQLGGLLAASSQAADDAVTAVSAGYGIPLGIAFQLRDDLLGVFGDPVRTGKPTSGDISEGKRTVLMALARERASTSQARLLEQHLGDRALTPAGASAVKAVLTDTGAVDECEALIAANVKDALAALDSAPVRDEAKSALAALAIMATDRQELPPEGTAIDGRRHRRNGRRHRRNGRRHRRNGRHQLRNGRQHTGNGQAGTAVVRPFPDATASLAGHAGSARQSAGSGERGAGGHLSRAASRAAAAPGSSASVMARTTTIRAAPASSTWSRLVSSMPPMANQGRSVARFAA